MPKWAIVTGQVLSYLSGIPILLVTAYGALVNIHRSGLKWDLPLRLLVFGLFGWAAGVLPAIIDGMVRVNLVMHNTQWVPGTLPLLSACSAWCPCLMGSLLYACTRTQWTRDRARPRRVLDLWGCGRPSSASCFSPPAGRACRGASPCTTRPGSATRRSERWRRCWCCSPRSCSACGCSLGCRALAFVPRSRGHSLGRILRADIRGSSVRIKQELAHAGVRRTAIAAALVFAAGLALAHAATDGFQAFTLESARRLHALTAPAPRAGSRARPRRRRPRPPFRNAGTGPARGFRLYELPDVLRGARLGLRAADGSAWRTRSPPAECVSYRSPSIPRAMARPSCGPTARATAADPAGWDLGRPAHAAELERWLKAFGVVVIPDGMGGYTHNAAVHVVGPDRRLAAIHGLEDIDAVVANSAADRRNRRESCCQPLIHPAPFSPLRPVARARRASRARVAGGEHGVAHARATAASRVDRLLHRPRMDALAPGRRRCTRAGGRAVVQRGRRHRSHRRELRDGAVDAPPLSRSRAPRCPGGRAQVRSRCRQPA